MAVSGTELMSFNYRHSKKGIQKKKIIERHETLIEISMFKLKK